MKCRHCRAIATSPPLGIEELERSYAESYYGGKSSRFNFLVETLIRWQQMADLGPLLRRSPGRILDVGSGRGFMLDVLRRRGWEVEGVELNATSAKYSKEVLGLPVRVGAFRPTDYPDARFDAIVMCHSLEHMEDPRTVLIACARLLRPGGVLAVTVPNFESWQARLFRYHWFHLDLPRHRFHFSAGWLIRHIEDLGFQVQRVGHFSLEHNTFGWIQSVQNQLGLPQNLLYQVLRRSPAREDPRLWRSHPVQASTSLVLLLVLLPIGFMMNIVEAVVRRGGTVKIFAVNPHP